jgi:hypothetical protein
VETGFLLDITAFFAYLLRLYNDQCERAPRNTRTVIYIFNFLQKSCSAHIRHQMEGSSGRAPAARLRCDLWRSSIIIHLL